MKQWFFKITEYADALLDEIEDLDWPSKIKTAQTNWIGKSQGAEIEFRISNLEFGSEEGNSIRVFTTRPDTIYGASFLVIAPEHPLAKDLATAEYKEAVEEYIVQATKKSEIERMNESREKTGVFTGSYAVNPLSGEEIPVWVADYVLAGYGTGAIMAVPAHDERDFAFAEKFKLPIKSVVAPDFGQPLPDAVDVTGPVVIGYDPNTGEFMSLINNQTKSRWLVGGGLESGETYEQAALRELKEEAGFDEVEELLQLGDPTYSYYYNNNKNSNRRSFSYMYLAIIDKNKQGKQHQESHENYTTVWSDLETIRKDWEGDRTGVEHWIETLTRVPDVVKSYEKKQEYFSPSYHGEGVLFNSGEYTGMTSSDAREKIVDWLETNGKGKSKITYKMRDWLISRQRYWGAPIPVIHCDEHGAVAVPEDQLPVLLPEIEDYAPKGDGKPALAREESWVNTTCPTCGKPAKRETDTMDGYACSSWYLLRYADPNNSRQAWDPETINYWAPVDYYIGGDHAVAHLLYVRFWSHVFKDMGLTGFKEPVKKLIYHGYINAEDGTKMSKSKGNVVDPLDVIEQGYGADALRTYLLFMGPIELDASWDSKGIAGVYRFLNRVWVLTQEYLESDKNFTGNDDKVRRAEHQAIRKVTEDISRLSFNTAISGLMEYVNELYKLKVDGFSDSIWNGALTTLAKLIAPFAPHISEELHAELGSHSLVQNTHWPVWDDALIASDNMMIVVQVNGKLRAKLELPVGASQEEVEAEALANENVASFVGNQKPTKIIYIPGRLVNIVV